MIKLIHHIGEALIFINLYFLLTCNTINRSSPFFFPNHVNWNLNSIEISFFYLLKKMKIYVQANKFLQVSWTQSILRFSMYLKKMYFNSIHKVMQLYPEISNFKFHQTGRACVEWSNTKVRIEINWKWRVTSKENSCVELWEQFECLFPNRMVSIVVGHCRFPVVRPH